MKTSILLGLVLTSLSVGVAAPPDLKGIFPAGGSPGNELVATAEGSWESWPVRWWVDRPGLSISCQEEKGKIQIRLDKQAGLGRYWIRALDDSGASELVPFVVSNGSSMTELEPNDHPRDAQPVGAFNAIDGKLGKRDDVDCFALELSAGETVHLEVQAHRLLGSPVDVVLQICDEQGRVLKHCDDDVGLDPALAFQAPRSGQYLLRLFGFPDTPDSTIGFAGGERLVYRLILHHGERPAEPTIRILGRSLSPILWSTGNSAASNTWHSHEGTVLVWESGSTTGFAIPWVPGIDVSRPEPEETEAIQVGQAITFAGLEADQALRLPIEFKPGQPARVKVMAQAIGEPMDPVLRIVKDDGEVVATLDDLAGSADPAYLWNGKPEEPLTLEIRDRFDRNLTDSFFVVAVERLRPDIRVVWKQDRWTGKVGEEIALTFKIEADQDLEGKWILEPVAMPENATASPLEIDAIKKAGGEHSMAIQAPQATAGPLRFVLRDSESGEKVTDAVVVMSPFGVEYRLAWLTVLADADSETSK